MAATGRRVAALAGKPELHPDLADEWTAFAELSAGRQHGPGGPQPLALADLLAWCGFFGEADPERFLRLMRAMDRAFLSHQHAAQNAAASRKVTHGSGRKQHRPRGND